MARLPRSLDRFMRRALVTSLTATLGCGGAPATTPATAPTPASAPAPAASAPAAPAPDLDARLTAIGAEDADDRLAEAYVALGPAALVHAARLARDDADGDRARGARRVLFALRRPEDFAFLEAFPSPTRDADGACAAIDLSEYLRLPVEHMATGATKVEKRAGARLPFVPAYAAMLARIADASWPTCTRTCPTCETTRNRPESVAVTILGEMTPGAEPPFLGDSASTEEPPEREPRFRAWWKANRARLVAAPTPRPAHAAVAPLPAAARTGKTWPFHAFTRAEAVTFNEVPISPGYPLRAVDDRGTSPHITARKPLGGADAKSATDLVAATLGDVSVSKCAFPRHAVILFDGEVPVASINVCFECGDILVWPPWSKDASEAAELARAKRQRPLYDKTFPKWQAFFRDRVGFPVDRRYR